MSSLLSVPVVFMLLPDEESACQMSWPRQKTQISHRNIIVYGDQEVVEFRALDLTPGGIGPRMASDVQGRHQLSPALWRSAVFNSSLQVTG